ncbi:MAG: hypothetical protein FJY98_03700 [Candidatus Liptonbacteria bacterium]|nr:hypothetical protein [Candidatus Liptonbacteria bacterium]
MVWRRFRKREGAAPAFEEAVAEVESHEVETVELPLGNRPLFYIWFVVLGLALLFVWQILALGWGKGEVYAARARANLEQIKKTPPLRGVITDRFGTVLAENSIVPYVFLEVGKFFKKEELQQPTLDALELIGIPQEEVWKWIKEVDADRVGERIPIPIEVNDRILVMLKGLELPTILVEDGVRRVYKKGKAFAHVLGYVGFPGAADLREDPTLSSGELIGKDGVERFYNKKLRGGAGLTLVKRDAWGNILDTTESRAPSRGETLKLTIDAELQSYFYERLTKALHSLGRKVGVGIAMDPKTGEVLALVQEPSYDNNILSGPGHAEEKKEILNSSSKPLFNRAVSGAYSPGSTVKPLVGIAALHEGVINPAKEIFAPGYLDIPNPFDPSKPTRYNDWRYHGYVNLAKAIAYSSDVYFYEVGGGAPGPGGQKGIGIERLREWWKKFSLGARTGIDLPGEVEGFLPSIEWKQKRDKKPWLLGDTYNVSIGQGDLLTTPIQLLVSLNIIATDGKVLQPVVAMDAPHPRVLGDFSDLQWEINEVEKGMQLAITDPKATIYALKDMPFSIAAKTGSAQIYNNKKVNAFFLGYAPVEDPQLIVMVLIEDAKDGSLNTIPVGGDVLKWYYENRIQKQEAGSMN